MYHAPALQESTLIVSFFNQLHIDRFISNQEYAKACTELISCLQSAPCENLEQTQFESMCLQYEQVIDRLEETDLKKDLFGEMITFLKKQLVNHPMANEKLICCVEAVLKSKTNPNSSEFIEAYLILDHLCRNSTYSTLIRKTLFDCFQRMSFFQEVKLPIKKAEDIQVIKEAAKISFGKAWPCMRTQLIGARNELKKKFKEVHAPIEMEYTGDAHFGEAIREALSIFRKEFEEFFNLTFLPKSIRSIDPHQVREFQKDIYHRFNDKFLDRVFILLKTLLDIKRVKTTLYCVGSLAREEIFPFSDFEGILVLDDSKKIADQVDEQGLLLQRIMECLGVLVLAIGETPTGLDNELLNLVDIKTRKGFCFDKTPICALGRLREYTHHVHVAAPSFTSIDMLLLLQNGMELYWSEIKTLENDSHTQTVSIDRVFLGRLNNLIEKQEDSVVRNQLSSLINPGGQDPLSDFFSRLADWPHAHPTQTQSVPMMNALRDIEDLIQKREKKRETLLLHYRKRLEELNTLHEQLTSNQELHTFLFSLLKPKQLFVTGGANFQYLESLRAILDNPVVETGLLFRQKRAEEMLQNIHLEDFNRFGDQDNFLRIGKIDLKKDLLAPIYYFINTFGIYYGVEETNSLDIVEKLADQGKIERQSAVLLQEIIASIYLIRTRLQFKFSSGSEEVINLSVDRTELLLAERKWVFRTYWLILRPLKTMLSQGMPDQLNFCRVFYPEMIYKLSIHEMESMLLPFEQYISYLIDKHRYFDLETLHQLFSEKTCLEKMQKTFQAVCSTIEELHLSAEHFSLFIETKVTIPFTGLKRLIIDHSSLEPVERLVQSPAFQQINPLDSLEIRAPHINVGALEEFVKRSSPRKLAIKEAVLHWDVETVQLLRTLALFQTTDLEIPLAIQCQPGAGDEKFNLLIEDLKEHSELLKKTASTLQFDFDSLRVGHLIAVILKSFLKAENSSTVSIDLSNQLITDKELPILVTALAFSKAGFHELNLNHNSIGDAGVVILSPILKTSRICTLLLQNNSIGSIGGLFLAAFIPDTLKNLDLGSNNIDDQGATALLKGLPGTSLDILNLSDNPISPLFAQTLKGSNLILKQQVHFSDIPISVLNPTGRKRNRPLEGDFPKFVSVLRKKVLNGQHRHTTRSDRSNIALKGLCSLDNEEIKQDLSSLVDDFLMNQAKKVLVVLGAAGVGKTTFMKQLELQLWENYRETDRNAWIPLFIDLPTIPDPVNHLFQGYLASLKFLESRRLGSLQSQLAISPTLIILDSYDRTTFAGHRITQNLINTNQLSDWRGKIIIAGRLNATEALNPAQENHLRNFAPILGERVREDLVQEIIIDYQSQ